MHPDSKPGRRGQVRKSWIFVLLIVILFFLINAALAYRSTEIINENAEKIEHSLSIITLIRELQVQLYAAESGQRGYLITADVQYLEPYHAAQNQIIELLQRLGRKSTELSPRTKKFKSIQSLMEDKLEEMKLTVELVEDRKKVSAARQESTDRSLNLTREIMNLISEVEQEEHRQLVKNRMTAHKNNSLILGALLAANGAGLLLCVVIYAVWIRYARNIKNLYREIEQANLELEQKVRERTNTLQRYAEELERSNRELQDFAFVASHDLQEPLRKIRAFGDRLLSKFSDTLGEQGVDYTKRMQAASERMSTLINDLLSFSRVTTRQKPFTSVDLNLILDQVLDDLEFAVEQSGAEISADPLPQIIADDSQLRQVFSNLLSNSIKFMPKGKQPRIAIRCTRLPAPDKPDGTESDGDLADERILLAFSDNGIGFDEHYKDRIFNLFQRLHSRDEYSGTGIGLALCRKIIERHGGTIEARSAPGEGTTFLVTLPVRQTNLNTETEVAI